MQSYGGKQAGLRYTGIHDEGYIDPVTGKFVFVPEMHSELVVPNLEGFKLVFFCERASVEIHEFYG